MKIDPPRFSGAEVTPLRQVTVQLQLGCDSPALRPKGTCADGDCKTLKVSKDSDLGLLAGSSALVSVRWVHYHNNSLTGSCSRPCHKRLIPVDTHGWHIVSRGQHGAGDQAMFGGGGTPSAKPVSPGRSSPSPQFYVSSDRSPPLDTASLRRLGYRLDQRAISDSVPSL